MSDTSSSDTPLPALKQRRWQPNEIAPIVSLVLLIGFFAVVARGFLSWGVLTMLLEQGSVLAIVSVGLTYVLLCAEIDLSVGYVALFSACLCGVVYEKPFAAGPGGEKEVSFLLTTGIVLLPLLCAMLLGLISGGLTVMSRLPSFIITLAMMNIAHGLAKYLTNSQPFELPNVLNSFGNGQFTVGKIGRDVFNLPYSTILAAAVMILGHIVLQHTRFGRFVYMTGGNREAARLAGVRTHRIVIACLAICAVTAAIGGLVNAGRLEKVTLDQNADLLLNAVACVVLGGTSLFGGEGSIPRTLIGVATFTVLKVGLNLTQVEDHLRPFVMGTVLMVALVINGYLSRKR